jgi:hypothetical protein
MRYPNGKHDEHQRPAATQTIKSVADAKIPRRSDSTSIMLGQEVERVTANSKALFLKAAELKRACENKCGSGEPGSMLDQPWPGIDEAM